MLAPSIPPPAVSAPAAKAASPVRYGFDGATMGMDLDSWRALKTTQGATCAPQPQKAGPPLEVCRAPDAPLGGAYQARDLTFTFDNSRLARIEFHTSIDGFNYVTAALKKDFGDPATIVRDTVKISDGIAYPHVGMTWDNGRSTIRLNDPSRSALAVTVQFSLDQSPSGPKA